MVYFVSKLELSDRKYLTNGNIRDEHHKGNFLFPIRDFLSFGTDHQSRYFMSNIFLKEKTDGVYLAQFQLAYTHNTTHTPNKKLVKLCHAVHFMSWRNQYLELQEWDDCINPHKTIILAIIMLVPNKNPQGYKEHIISCIAFDFRKYVTIIDFLANMKLYVSNIEE